MTIMERNTNQDQEKKGKIILKEEIEKGIRSIMEGQEFKNWLDTTSRFYTTKYSVNNAVLIYKQKPSASFTMGFEAWKYYGRIPVKNSGIKILAPVIAYEKKEGALFALIKNNLKGQLKKDPDLISASYKIGKSNLEFTMNRNGLIGLKMNGTEIQIFNSEDEAKRFLGRAVIGKIPMYYTTSHVFDVSDTVTPQYLWMKKGFEESEIVRDSDGRPIKNKQGETKIYNTPERINRFRVNLNTEIPKQDHKKMQILIDVLKKISSEAGVPVSEKSRSEDENLRKGADGYYSKQNTSKGFICIAQDLELTEKTSVLIHEIAYSHLHKDKKALAQEMNLPNIPYEMGEIQAEAVAYMTGKQFGIETATSSFKYLASYSKGFELQDLKQSLQVIYNEFVALATDIKKELENRGLDMKLEKIEEKIIPEEEIRRISKDSIRDVLREEDNIEMRKRKVFMDMYEYKDQPVRDVLQAESRMIGIQEQEIQKIKEYIETLEHSTIREEQDAVLHKLDRATERLKHNRQKFQKIDLDKKEMGKTTALEKILEKLPDEEKKKKIKERIAKHTSYLENSNYIQSLCLAMQNKPSLATDMLLKQLDGIDQVASRKGLFVEVQSCDNELFETPLIREGTICHPKQAEEFVRQAEKLLQEEKGQAEKDNYYLPYVKCRIAMYDAHKWYQPVQLRFGMGDQNLLSEYVKKACPEIINQEFQEALQEKTEKEKELYEPIPIPTRAKQLEALMQEAPDQEDEKETANEKGMNLEAWKKEIGKLRGTGEGIHVKDPENNRIFFEQHL